ncbi:MAG: hypothetical protein QOC86_547 [Gaiellales bacterium]|nr:hypothetical protein [Gaiellales bacterium]
MPQLGKRRRLDRQPVEPRTVLLATDGREPISRQAIERAAALASPAGVAVLAIAKIYGTQFGLPHPGLMPTKAEVDLRRGWIADAIEALGQLGVEADGQLGATRKPIKLIARVAVARAVEHVVVDEGTAHGVRLMVEGDTGKDVRRRLRGAAEVVVVPRA